MIPVENYLRVIMKNFRLTLEFDADDNSSSYTVTEELPAINDDTFMICYRTFACAVRRCQDEFAASSKRIRAQEHRQRNIGGK